MNLVKNSPIYNKLSLVQVIAEYRISNKPLPEPAVNAFTEANVHHLA